MAWRIIVRLSFNKDTKSTIRNNVVAPVLKKAGLKKRPRSTATWESDEVDETLTAKQLAELLPRLADAGEEAGANPNVKVDHIWIYIDQAKVRSKTR